MRLVIQRVARAGVAVKGELHSSIGKGLLVLVGIEESDNEEDIRWLVNKMMNLRIFDDSQGVMNLSSVDIGSEILIVSQFTLHAMVKKGNRPSYIRAARPETAIPLYNRFIEETEAAAPGKVSTGVFGAMMDIELVNEGPVTILIDSKNRE